MSPFPIPCVNRTRAASTHVETAIGRELDGAVGPQEPPLDEPKLIEPLSAVDALVKNEGPKGGSENEGDRAKDDDSWVTDLNQLLRFNASFAGRGRGRGTS